jgi:hypothetical protein
MKRKEKGPPNPGVFSVYLKEGERLAKFLIYFSFDRNQTRCINYGCLKKFQFLGGGMFIYIFYNSSDCIYL